MDPPIARLVAVASVLALLAAGAHAQDAAPRVALVDPGVELEAAVRSALEPWGVEVLVAPGPSPGAIAPDSNDAARALAAAHGASALAWVSEHDGQYALWVYDVATDHAIERALLQGPPFDGAAAAALALSVKTLLRHSAAAPPEERYGAESLPAARTPAASSPRTSAAAQAKTAVPAEPADGSEHAPQDDGLEADERPFAPALLELALLGGARLGATDPGAVESRFGLAASFWPERGALGMGARASFGPAFALRDARFDGELYDAAGGLALALRHDLARQVRLQAAIEAGLHVLVLEGSVPDEARDTSATRVAPALALQLQGDWALGARVRLGLWLELGYLLRAERYLVHEAAVLELSHLAANAGLALSLALIE